LSAAGETAACGGLDETRTASAATATTQHFFISQDPQAVKITPDDVELKPGSHRRESRGVRTRIVASMRLQIY
jgi:hypothetical protein